MTKRIISLLFVLILAFSVVLVPASADTQVRAVLDDSANLLNSEEEKALADIIAQVSSENQCNLAFVTVNDLYGASFSHNGTAQDYADMYYETNFGKNTDGIVVLLVLSDERGKRTVYFSTSGKCIKRLSDSEREKILDDIIANHNPDTKSYYEFLYAAALDLKEALPPHLKWYMLPLALLIGFAIAMIIMMILRGQLKSVKMEKGAVNYVRAGSMNVTASRDSYLYSTVSRTAKPKDSGSSTHTSSGGGSHGGGGRSF